MRRRVAFLDIDGTIADGAGRIAESTVRAVRDARAKGHLVLLSTGRALVEIAEPVRAIGFDGAVTTGGGYAALGDEVVIERPMPDDLIAEMLSVLHEYGCEYYLQSYDGLYPSDGVHVLAGRLLTEVHGLQMTDAELLAHPRVQALTQQEPVPTTGIAKGAFLTDRIDVHQRVAERLGDRFHVFTGSIPGMGGGSGEITAAGVNKGTTILQLLAMLDIDPADAIGIGDGANDVEMLQVCGVGVAMPHASALVREHADEVTTGVLDDGVWNAFARHGLA